MTRRIARRAWRLLRPGHTRPARTMEQPPQDPPPQDPPPRWVRPTITPDSYADAYVVEKLPPPEVIEDWRVPVWEDDVRAESEAKTRRLKGDT